MRASPRPNTGSTWPLLFFAPLAAVVLYGVTINRTDFDAPDLEVVSPNQQAARLLTADQIWLAPIPHNRADLGAYRPVQSLALALQYRLWPANPKGFHRFSLAVFALTVVVFYFLAAGLIGTERPGAFPGVAMAVFIFAVHPMASEAVDWIAAQSVLIAAFGWVFCLWVYHCALERRLHHAFAAPLAALAYFIAYGAYEAAVVLPLAILALDRLKSARIAPDRETATASDQSDEHGQGGGEPESFSRTGLFRLFVYGLPFAAVFAALTVLRWIALDGAIGPLPNAQTLADSSAPSRLITGMSALALGVRRLVLPLRPTFFYPMGYEEGVLGPFWLGPITLAAMGTLIVVTLRRGRALALGLALAIIGLIPLLQVIPLTQVFSERMLLLALPGLALAAGEAVALLAERPRRRTAPGAVSQALAFTLTCIIGALAAMTFTRNRQWADSTKLWAAEEKLHPEAPGPLIYQMMDLVANSGGNFDVEAIEDRAARALELAHPPQTDPIYQYRALMQMKRGDKEKLVEVVTEGLEAPGPHAYDYFSSLGLTAIRVGDLELADAAFTRQLEVNPRNIDTIFSITEMRMRAKQWPEALETARLASELAPSSLKAIAYLNYGKVAAQLNQNKLAFDAFSSAIQRDRRLGEAYLALARLLVKSKNYRRAEEILTLATRVVKVPAKSYVEYFKIQVESLELQGATVDIYDFLQEICRLHPRDTAAQVYAGQYLVDKMQYRLAGNIYNRMLAANPKNADALLGLGMIAINRDGDIDKAQRYWLNAMRANPLHQGVLKALSLLDTYKKQIKEGRTPADADPAMGASGPEAWLGPPTGDREEPQ